MTKPLKISRSGLKLFLECPRCFWLDLHHKIKRPPGYPYTLSAAVDYLVKREFDKFRADGTLPEVLIRADINAKLYPGPELATWRNNFKGISFMDEDLQAMIYGAVDDILEFPDGSLAVVDYKSSGSKEITIYADYQKQMDTYNYILNRMGYKTQPHAYFVFYKVNKTGGGFNNVLPFDDEVRTVPADPSWVGPAFERAVKTARQDQAPQATATCTHCVYVASASSHGGVELADTQSDTSYTVVPEE